MKVRRLKFEKNDRGFKPGDILRLREWDPDTQQYTGRSTTRVVTYIIQGQFGLPDDTCVMSLGGRMGGRKGMMGTMGDNFQVILGEIGNVSLAEVRVGVEYFYIDGVDINEIRLPRDERTLVLVKELIEKLLQRK